MKKTFFLLIMFMLVFYVYQNGIPSSIGQLENVKQNKNSAEIIRDSKLDLINAEGQTVKDRIKVPAGFERVKTDTGTFEEYLQNLILKSDGARVRYFNGKEKTKDVYVAVIDMEIGDRDLQQCADAVIRLRAEYLYGQKQYEKIHFNFVNGFNADYGKWMAGNRIVVDDNQVSWVKKSGYQDDYESFRKYLDLVFAYAGTASLAKELNQVPVAEMKIGDVFIQGGSPGHCVIVIDTAENKETGEKIFLLAQSYMPAQDIQILKNSQNEKTSPWYSSGFGDTLITPEWQFSIDDLKRFGED